METVSSRILAWGKKEGCRGVRGALVRLLCRWGMDTRRIASKFSCSSQSIRNLLIRNGLLRPKKRFLVKLKELGYSNAAEFFTDPVNVRKSIAELARKAGFSYMTVSQKYTEFLNHKDAVKRRKDVL